MTWVNDVSMPLVHRVSESLDGSSAYTVLAVTCRGNPSPNRFTVLAIPFLNMLLFVRHTNLLSVRENCSGCTRDDRRACAVGITSNYERRGCSGGRVRRAIAAASIAPCRNSAVASVATAVDQERLDSSSYID